MSKPIVKLAYDQDEAAAMVGCSVNMISAAINSGALIMRRYADYNGRIAHYDLEVWLLGLDDYVKTIPDVRARHQEEQDKKDAEAAERSRQRREAKAIREAQKAAKEAEDAQLAADLEELERLRELSRQ